MLHLASKSPRRRELLARLGVPFTPLDVDVPEAPVPGETPRAYVCRVAREKAVAGWRSLGDAPETAVLGADTEVVLDGEVFGKPRDAEAAAAMLRRLSGRTHTVVSAVTLCSAAGERQAVSVTEVTFAGLAEADIAAYVAGGEPMGKAGGYAIQGGAEAFVAHLAGSYSGVVGLPLFETAGLLRAGGFPVAGFAAPAARARAGIAGSTPAATASAG
ncbi:Maf family protein [Luteimonas sp. R10]|uniref:Maf family protein n=1 Tax=Luteimonas sp. R10 TaxID=3108176 RepID=UPI0030905ABC|nr:nucleoside triphosphate pyrophosphatase [Luteimonas sp. R10]